MIMSQVFKFIDSKSTHKNLYILRKNLFFNLKNKLRSQAYNVLINQLSADLVVCKMLCLCKLHAKIYIHSMVCYHMPQKVQTCDENRNQFKKQLLIFVLENSYCGNFTNNLNLENCLKYRQNFQNTAKKELMFKKLQAMSLQLY